MSTREQNKLFRSMEIVNEYELTSGMNIDNKQTKK